MLIKNIGQLLHFSEKVDNPVFENCYMLIKDGKIDHFDTMDNLPLNYEGEIIDVKGKVITPGFIDSHTHLIFSGDRSDEFELRSKGADYEDILKAGGGINNTVKSTREIPFSKLFKDGLKRLNVGLNYGITTYEIKSGYGLDEKTEWKILEVIKSLKRFSKQNIQSTYLGAHIVPKEYKENRKKYIDLILDIMLPNIKKREMADCVDVFIENSAFSVEEGELIIKKAKELDFLIHLHTDQLSHLGGTALGAKYNVLSVDHLECYKKEDIEILKNSSTVATFLPTATLFLNKDNYPNARPLIDSGIKVALATDFNPGSSHTQNINLIISLGVLKHKMSILEAIKGVTLNAAYAIGAQNEIGSLERGKFADFIIHDTDNYKQLAYKMGDSLVESVFIKGEKICLNKIKSTHM